MAPESNVLVAAEAELGEGPVWDAARSTLFWVDIMRGLVHETSLDGATRTWDVGEHVGAVALAGEGRLVAATRAGFVSLDLESGETRQLALVEEDRPGNRMNDGKCDPRGRFWAGTMSYDAEPGAGALYVLDLDGTVRRALGGVTISNGLAWSAAGDALYYVDSALGRLDRFDFDGAAGTIGGRTTVAEIPADDGLPDGIAIDEEGALWVALWDGWAVRRYLPDGSVERELRFPAARITSCAFGGADLRTLFVTSARNGLADDELRRQPAAGSVFAVDAGVRGTPTVAYAGP